MFSTRSNPWGPSNIHPHQTMSKHVTYSIPQDVCPFISGPFKLDLVSIKRIFFLVSFLLGLISCLFFFFQRTKKKKKIRPPTKPVSSEVRATQLIWDEGSLRAHLPSASVRTGRHKDLVNVDIISQAKHRGSGLMAGANVLLRLHLYQ